MSTVSQVRRLIRSPLIDPQTDRELLRRFAGGEEAAFAELVTRHAPMVLGVARRITGNDADAEDVLQATFLVLLRQANQKGWRDCLAGWLHGVARRLALRARSEAARRSRQESQAEGAQDTDPADELAWDIDEKLQRLPVRHRLPIVLCYLEGRTRASAARELGWPLRTLERRLGEARDKLRDRLRDYGPTAGCLTALMVGPITGAASPRARALADGFVAGNRPVTAMVLAVGLAAMLLGGVGLGTDEPAPKPAEPAEKAELPDGAIAVFGDTRFRHPGGASDIAHSPDGKTLAVAGHRWVELWNAETGKMLQAVRPSYLSHRATATHVAFSPDGKTVAFATRYDTRRFVVDSEPGREFRVRLWELKSGTIRDLPGQDMDITGLAYSPDGKRLVWTSLDASAVIWDVASGKPLRRFEWDDDPSFSTAVSPEGTRVAFGKKGTITVHEVATGAEWKAFLAGEEVTSLAFSADGKYLASGGETVSLWDLNSAERRALFRSSETSDEDGRVFGRIKDVAFSPDGKRLAAAHVGKLFQRSGEGFVPGGVKLWDLDTMRQRDLSVGERANGRAIDFSPTGNSLVAATAGETVTRWEFDGDAIRVQRGEDAFVYVCKFLSDGRHLLRGGARRTAVIDMANGKTVRTFDRQRATPFGGQPGRPEVATWDGLAIEVHDVSTGRSAKPQQVGTEIDNCRFSPDGSVALVSDFQTFWLWDVKAGKEISRIEDGRPAPFGYWAAISVSRRVVALPLMMSSMLDPPVGLFSFEGKAIGDLPQPAGHKGSFDAMAFSPDGRYLVAVEQVAREPRGVVWDIEKRRVFSELRYHPGRPAVLPGWTFNVDVSPDGALIATTHEDGIVCLWELRTGGLIREFKGHRGYVTDVDFSPDGERLVTSASDGLSIVWDLSAK